MRWRKIWVVKNLTSQSCSCRVDLLVVQTEAMTVEEGHRLIPCR